MQTKPHIEIQENPGGGFFIDDYWIDGTQHQTVLSNGIIKGKDGKDFNIKTIDDARTFYKVNKDDKIITDKTGIINKSGGKSEPVTEAVSP